MPTTWINLAAAATTLADMEKELSHQLAIVEVAEREVVGRRAMTAEAQERANGAAELLAEKVANLNSYNDGLAIIQESNKDARTSLRIAHKRLFSEIEEDDPENPSSDPLSSVSADSPGPCLSCGRAGPRYRAAFGGVEPSVMPNILAAGTTQL
ncbi:hypothetical protein CF326_g3065 [Tilletia indica]|nr:hypothetical protein CF326_g3065 [Tilletia indica]